MGLETGTYISDLNTSNPASSDGKSAGDDHIRLIKSTVKATFPNVAGAVTPTHTELNYVAGVTSAVQTQINTKGAIAGQVWTGTHDYTTATAINVPAPTTGSNAVTKTYADNLSFATALPAQTGNSGKVITTNGTAASWSAIGTALQTIRVNSAGTGLEGVTESLYDKHEFWMEM